MDFYHVLSNRISALVKEKPVLWWILIFITFSYGVYFQAETLINHDVSWYLYGAQRMLGGARLYRDIIEVNPPLNFYLTIIPVIIAKIFNLPSTAVYKGFIFFIGWVSLSACFYILKKIYDKRDPSLIWFLTFILSLIFFTHPMTDFGQREHIMIMLCMPYLLSAVLFLQNKHLSAAVIILTACMALTGFALKPFFLLSWITTECFIIFKTKSIKIVFKRLENLIIAAGMLIYFILMSTVWTDYFIIAKMALKVYHSYNTPLKIILLFRYDHILMLIFACFAFFMLKKNKTDLLISLLLLQLISFLIIGFMQGKGWPYHFIPYWSCVIFFWGSYIGLCAVKIDQFKQLKKIIKFGAQGVMIITAVYLIIFRVAIPIYNYEPSYKRVVARRLVDFIDKNIFPKSIFIFSTSVDPAFPTVNYSGSKWASRFNCLWLLPGNYKIDYRPQRYHDESSMNYVEQYVYRATISDLLKNQPELLIFETRNLKQGFFGKEFDFLKYFSRNKKFRGLMDNYDLIHHIEDYAIYRKK
ncbi:hypothetical protein J7L67_07695 [bacterium]|nr:hypothetical protein [bacterium]